MNSILLTILSHTLFWILCIISVYLLFRGHQAPGGGFIGGLVASVAYALATKGMGREQAKKLLRTDPINLVVLGLFLLIGSGLFALFANQTFMTGQWREMIGVAISSVMLFDSGVFFVVLGGTLLFLFSLEDAEG